MNSDRRPRRHGPSWVAGLLVTLVAALAAFPASASPLPGDGASIVAEAADPIPTRIEGLLKSTAGTLWLVDQTRVEVRPATVVDQSRGRAEPGAWVSVWGDKGADRLTADTIRVLRPKGAEPPVVQFSGILTKLTAQACVVSGKDVDLTQGTTRPADLPLFSLVTVTGYRTENGVMATAIELLARDEMGVPVYIEGEVEQVVDATVVVDGRTVRLRPEDAARVDARDWLEIKARVAQDGSLAAEQMRVVDRALDAKLDAFVTAIRGLGEDDQVWSVVTFDGGRVQSQSVRVAAETYVDEDRATLQPDIEATIEGSKLDALTVKADMVRLNQPETTQLAGQLTENASDGLWSLNDTPVWFPSGDMLWQARSATAAAQAAPALGEPVVVVSGLQLSNGVLVAKAVRAATAADLAAQGAVAEAGISGTDWSGPIKVAPDVSLAGAPQLLYRADGAAHAVYESDGLIYYTSQLPGRPWGAAVKIAKGTAPSAVLDARGNLHVAYVNEFMRNYDIYTVRLAGGRWTLPTNLSGTSGQSADPSLTADATGTVYVAWMDTTSGPWAIHTGEWDGGFWTSYPVSNARGGSPSIAVFPDGKLFLAWQDRVPSATNSWGTNNIYGAEGVDGKWDLPVNVSDNSAYSPGAESIGVTAVTGGDGRAHLAWIDNERQLRYDFGRGLYWPAPVNLGAKQTSASGLAMRAGRDNMLYVGWDNGDDALTVRAPLGAQSWPAPEVLPTLPGKTTNVSLAFARNGLAIAWLQKADAGSIGIYEAHPGDPILLRSYAPLLFNP